MDSNNEYTHKSFYQVPIGVKTFDNFDDALKSYNGRMCELLKQGYKIASKTFTINPKQDETKN